MPHKTLVVLKLGGSIITAKNSPHGRIRTALLRQIGKQLVVYLNQPSHQLLLLHGAGAPGHRLAQRYDLQSGVRGNAQRRAAARRGQRLTARLNRSVVSVLASAGLPIVPVLPPTVIQQRAGQLRSMKLGPIKKILAAGRVPILYGDIVPDSTWDLSICSADASSSYLAKKLSAGRLLFATDTDGVMTDDPHYNKHARLMKKISLSSPARKTIKHSHSIDVTGGMSGKVAAIKKIFSKNKLPEVIIFNGMIARRYAAALGGNLKTGTHLVK